MSFFDNLKSNFGGIVGAAGSYALGNESIKDV